MASAPPRWRPSGFGLIFCPSRVTTSSPGRSPAATMTRLVSYRAIVIGRADTAPWRGPRSTHLAAPPLMLMNLEEA